MMRREDKKKETRELCQWQCDLHCEMCGSNSKPETCSWQEDDDGAWFCQDCWAERESCGCSD